jgi:TonB-dependent starch-binding outer membrane protein SusC
MKKNKPFGEMFYRSLKKTLLIMRIAVILMILGILQANATNAYSQKTRLSLNFTETKLITILDKIEDESEFFFLYNEKLLDTDRKISISENDQLIGKILDDMFSGTDVKYSIIDRKIILAPVYLTEVPQQKQITGTVKGKDGSPLPGVNVVITGTTQGTITDIAGKYSIPGTPGAKSLTFSFIGMEPQEISIGTSTEINVTMAESAIGLEEVVVIGYGSMKKSDLTGALSSISPEELLKRHPVTMEQGLQGMAAGVQVVRTSGSPEGGTSVRIRGTATINNSAEPLYVVDGIMVGTNANFLNPNDIEAIEVLKDASSTAIYGARGANGVVMITTKKGIKGQVKLTLDASWGLQTQKSKINVANAEQFATASNKACANDGFIPNPVWANPSALNNINWQNEMARPSMMQQYNLSGMGGSENTQVMMSVGYLGNEGIIRASEYQRITARANITHSIKDFIRTGLNVSFMHSESKRANVNPMDYVGAIPTMDTLSNGNLLHVPVQYPDGTWGHFPREGNGGYNTNDNPVAVAETADELYYNNRVLTNAFVEIDLLKNLTFKTVGGVNYNGTGDHTYAIRQHRTFYPNPTDDFSMNQRNNMEYILENYLTYNLTFGKNRLTALLGHSVSKGSSENISASASDFAVNTIRNVGLTLAPETLLGGGGLGIPTREQSIFGRITYSYADRYLLTATVRRDGSSNFGAGNKYGTFPSLSLGWRISEEEFMHNQNIFSNLKLRAGWGQTGNAGNPTNLSVDQLSSNRIAYYLYNPADNTFTIAPGFTQITEIDTKLKWETNEQLNIGFDMAILKNTLTFTVDYFRRDAKDLLLYKGLRPSTGFSQIYTNAGQIRNTGLEFQIGYKKSWGDWNLNLNANATTVKNQTVDVGKDIYSNYGVNGIDNIDVGAWWGSYSITRNGFPVGSYFGWRTDGIFQTQAEIDALNASAIAAGASKGAYQSIGTKPGDRKYKDLDGNGWIDDLDREILGNGYPKLTYGLNVNLSYKSFDFNMYFYGVAGQDILSYSYHNLLTSGTNMLTDYAINAWDGQGSTNVYPRFTRADPNHNGQVSDAFILNGDFLKVQNVQLGYTFPKNLLKRIKMESARVFVSVENLLTISKYDVGDPEVGNGNVQQTGFDGGKYPFPQIYTFGVNFGF